MAYLGPFGSIFPSPIKNNTLKGIYENMTIKNWNKFSNYTVLPNEVLLNSLYACYICIVLVCAKK